MRHRIIGLALFMLVGLPALAMAAGKPYFYPYVNPLEATVMELPPYSQVDLPDRVPTRTFKLKVFPDRQIPKVFWYEKGLVCSLTYQKKKAPLVFVIAGTGARYNSPKMVNMQKALYQAGYHVISLTSPTHMQFIINASSTMTPGHVYEDAKDLYRVMQLAWDKVKDDIEVSGFHLTGYSLGGMQSAFVAKLDDEKKIFNFKRVLLINPPVNLYNSVNILDQMLVDNIPGGLDNFDSWIDTVMEKLAEAEEDMGYWELSGDYIYKAYKRFPPREDFLASLVGVAFRMSSTNMIFAADVMKGGGYITPKDVRMSNSTSLVKFMLVGEHTSFADYFTEHFVPFFQQKDASLTEEKLIDILSLRSIEPYLRRTGKIGLLHNEDDIILQQGEIDYLEEVFGTRANIYSIGGHCGNMNHPDVVDFYSNFFAGQEG